MQQWAVGPLQSDDPPSMESRSVMVPDRSTRRPARWRDNARDHVQVAWLATAALMLLGTVEHALLGSSVLAISGLALFVLSILAWLVLEFFIVRPVPEDDRPPDMRGPLPGGRRWGRWYANPHDPRSTAYDAKGRPILNYSHPLNRHVLALAVCCVLLATASVVTIVIIAMVVWLTR